MNILLSLISCWFVFVVEVWVGLGRDNVFESGELVVERFVGGVKVVIVWNSGGNFRVGFEIGFVFVFLEDDFFGGFVMDFFNNDNYCVIMRFVECVCGMSSSVDGEKMDLRWGWKYLGVMWWRE